MPVIDKKDLVPKTGSGYPEPFSALGRYTALPLSDAGRLTQFGVFFETLDAGSFSSQRHWHEEEDEFLYMLSGEVTLIEDDAEYILRPGDAATWKAGVPNGHHLHNRSGATATYLLVGSRKADDACHYPDIDLHFRRKDGTSSFFHKDGTPYPKRAP